MSQPQRVMPLDLWKRAARDGGAPADAVVVKAVAAEVRVLDETTRRVGFRITTGAPDRMRDTIDPTGWDVRAYRRNPVVLWAHRYDEPPVARAVEVTADAQGLRSVAEFATKEQYPFADTVYQLIRGGFLGAVSVGFKPMKHVYNEARGGVDFLAQELLEYSIVPIPANPDALIEGKALDLDPLRTWLARCGGVAPGRDDGAVVLDLDDDEVDVSRADVVAAVKALVPELAAQALARAPGHVIDLDAIDGDDFDPVANSTDRALLLDAVKIAGPAMLRAQLNRLRGRVD